MLRNVLRSILLLVVTLPSVAEAQRSPHPRVVASGREVRVVFPTDTMQRWGWPAQTRPDLDRRYIWSTTVQSPSGGKSLMLVVAPADSSARSFRSLAALVAAGTASLCGPSGGFLVCDDTRVKASVVDGSVVLSMNERPRIAQLFRLKPAFVRFSRRIPSDGFSFTLDSARVEYVAPLIPDPDSATRAEAVRLGREREAASRRTYRYIAGGTQNSKLLWLAEGDSAVVTVEQVRCQIDVCTRDGVYVRASAWGVADSSVVAIRAVPQPSINLVSQAVLVGRKPGRTVLRVDSLSREIVVTPPIARVTLVPPPGSIAVGQVVEFGVRMLDLLGNPVEGVPMVWKRDTGVSFREHHGPAPLRVAFEASGPRMVIASFASRADTLVVNVMPKP